MKSNRGSTGQRGFTLIELMVVVAIVGVLSVLAIFGVRKYISQAKTAEARNSIGQMGKDAAMQWDRESMAGAVLADNGTAGNSHNLCSSGSASVPANLSQVAGQKYQSSKTDWDADQATQGKGFACLRFSVDAPQYYVYSYAATTSAPFGQGGAVGDNFTATAQGDLNGDGIPSTFAITGAVNGDLIMHLAPNLTETNPEE